jgi:hypothetical protein
MEFKIGDKIMISSKIGKPVYGFDENNVYGKIGVSEEKWSSKFTHVVQQVWPNGDLSVSEITDIIDLETHNVRLATEEEIMETEEENRKNYEAVQRALNRGEQMGEVLGRGQAEADKEDGY